MKKSKKQKPDRIKKMLWQSMRILKKGGFSVPELLMTAPGATLSGAQRFVKDLERHSIVAKIGGTPVVGRHQRYRLISERETVAYPIVCTKCKNPLHRKCIFFEPEPNKETERETEKRVKRDDATVKPLPAAFHQSDEWHKIPEGLKEHLERKLKGEEEEHHDAA